MTLTDYMNPEKFPATSQKGLSPEKQLRIDAFNHDQMVEAIGRGLPMNKMQEEAWEELQAKRPWMAELTRQIAAAMNIDKMPEMAPPMINTDMDEVFLSEAGEECESFASLFGNSIMAITNDTGLSSADKCNKVLGALKLMGEDDKDEDIEKMLGNAIMEIINDDDLSTADKRKKVLGALKLQNDDDEMP